MPKNATVKDVIYALQFGNELLVPTHANGFHGKIKWSLSRSHMPVDQRTADEVRRQPDCVPVGKSYGWKSAA